MVLSIAAVGYRQQQVPALLDQPKPLTRRRLALEGAHNLRQLGEIPVRGGKVRSGWVYRSNSLCRITPLDVDTLNAIGFHCLLDFRLSRERTPQKSDPPAFLETLVVHDLPMQMELSRDGYARMPSENRDSFRKAFHFLAQRESYPILFHCVTGKDRTGIVSALLLALLGAERSVILDDYMESQRNGGAFHVEEDWINGTLDAVAQSGGIEAYLESYGVNPAEQRSIRQILIVARPGVPEGE